MAEGRGKIRWDDDGRWRIIAPEQKQDGYVEKIGDAVYQRDYKVLWRQEDGNYVVREPEPEKPLYRLQ